MSRSTVAMAVELPDPSQLRKLMVAIDQVTERSKKRVFRGVIGYWDVSRSFDFFIFCGK